MLTKKMKDSGIEWVGEIPEDWLLVKYKRFAKSGMGVTLLKSDLLDRETADSIPVYSATQGNEFFGYTENKKLLLECGDLVIPARGNSIGHIKVVDKTATSTQTTIYSKVFSNEINIMFLKYCSDGLKDNWFKFDDTAIPQITVNQVNNNPVPYPSLKEQEKIVKILNKITQKVDNILKQTQQSIKELKKYKQSLITESVTKGLDPNVEMKDSGVGWIENIPKHWKFIKGKYIFKKLQRPIRCDEIVTAFRDGQVMQRSKRRTEGFTNSLKEIGYQGVEKGDLVIHSMDAFAGAIGISQDNGKCSPVCIVLNSFNSNIYNPYFSYLMRVYAYLGYIESMAKGIRVRSSDFKYHTFANTFLLIPKLQEQQQIVQYLDNKISIIDRLIEDKTKVIEELENYKKSLIYEYVTGKKEV
ncbi:restriction endonuclease subunit S [Staphylococcus epidermidis]|nr:restriction endonuclease subunit S [Staphylococcus epidermidis]OFS80733.1 restriction endonuclease subunit S [Staphylococcus sp. HMSC06C11]HCD8274067.1 restriction endonuclease subunit S [Staphylococcus aureus]MCG1491857.1 restriction endonuclease subunit S [Staphylococcus epidermidis]MCG1700715.1 restriction endonuclease subunit S [Staphylococcus epidermidis]